MTERLQVRSGIGERFFGNSGRPRGLGGLCDRVKLSLIHILAGDIDAVCGPEFLANIRTNLTDYRSMVLHAEVASLDVSLIESVRQVAEAVVDYAVSVCGTVDRHDPQTIRQASNCLLYTSRCV